MKNIFKKNSKVIALALTVVMSVSLMSVGVFADSDKGNGNGNGNTGTGQTEAKIHLDQELGNGSLTVTINGTEYQAESKGSHITIEMGTTDNGFDIDQGETMEIGFTKDGKTGTITFGH